MTHRWMAFLAVALPCGAAAQPAIAAETCYDYCTAGCPAGEGRSECTDECSVRCSPGGDLEETHPWNPNYYGAIAYDAENVAYGWSYGMGDEREAEMRALSGCRDNGDACKVVVTFVNSCAAVAANGTKRFKVGQGGSRDEAQAKALSACGRDCEIKVWSCSLP